MVYLLWCLLILLCISAYFTLKSRKKAPWSRLRCPNGLPIIGHLHLLGTLAHQSMSELSKRHHVDGLMMLKLGSVPTLVVSTADAAREVLTTHDFAFSSRPNLPAMRLFSYGNKDIAWSRYGPYWREMRKLCTLELFTVKRLDESRKIRSDEFQLLLKSIMEHHSRNVPVNLDMELSTLSVNIILQMAFSTRSMDPKFLPIIHQIVSNMGSFYFGDFFPSLWWLDHLTGSTTQLKRYLREIDGVIQAIIDDHKCGPRREHLDLLDIMLSSEMEPTSIKAVVLDMITAGTDTASRTAEWAISELLNNPLLMEKAQHEMDHIVGRDRLVNENDLPKLKYLGAVIKETFRLHPILPLLLPRESSQEVNIRGYNIASNTRLIINAWSVGRDADFWGQDVLEFDPERFLGRETDIKGRHFELIPFGGGRRICPGLSLGMCMVELMVALMVQCFDWKLEDGNVDMKEGAGITMRRENALKAFASPRLALHLY